MTIPTIIAKTQEKVAVSRLKKAYSTLENAYRLILSEEGTPDNWGITGENGEGAEIVMNKFATRLRLLKSCGIQPGCLPDVTYKTLDGGSFGNLNRDENRAKAQLADGTYLVSNSRCGSDCGCAFGNYKMCGFFYIDINGQNSPNQLGIDTFYFTITKSGILPFGTEQDVLYPFNNSCSNSKTMPGWGCAAWVIYNENMDYLKCNDLSWSGKKKCG